MLHPDPRPLPLRAFLATTFALTWGLAALALIDPTLGARLLPVLLYPAVAAPSLAAAFWITRTGGREALLAWLRRWGRWRVPLGYWLIPLVVTPAVGVAAWWLQGAVEDRPLVLSTRPLLALLAALPLALAQDPGWLEEGGWRGAFLPALMARGHSWLRASLLVVCVTAVWHLPAWLVTGMSQDSYGYQWFLLFHVSCAIIAGWLVSRTGSILLAAVLHAVQNLVATPGLGADIHDAGPVMALVALVLVLGSLLTRSRRRVARTVT